MPAESSHVPSSAATAASPRTVLRLTLQAAKPQWTVRDLTVAVTKLAHVGVRSTADLARALESNGGENLNLRIRQAGLKAFGQETLVDLKRQLSTADAAEEKAPHLAEDSSNTGVELRSCEAHALAAAAAAASGQEAARGELASREQVPRQHALAAQLQKVLALKCVAVQEEDYLLAHTVLQWQRKLEILLGGFEDTGTRLTRRLEALEKELGATMALNLAALEAADHDTEGKTNAHVAELKAQIARVKEAQQCEEGKGNNKARGCRYVTGKDATIHESCASQLIVDAVEPATSTPGDEVGSSFSVETPRLEGGSRTTGNMDLDGILEASIDLEDLAIRAEAQDFALQQLEHPAIALELIERLERLDTFTASELHAECKRRGIAAEEGALCSELVPLLQKAQLRDELSHRALREICRDQGVEVGVDAKREDLQQLLLELGWEALGIPIGRLPNTAAAQAALAELPALRALSDEDLTIHCRMSGIPVEPDEEPEQMRRRLQRLKVWACLPPAELVRECWAWGVLPTGSNTATAATAEEEVKTELIARLATSLHADDQRRAVSCGIAPNQLEGGSAAAAELLEQFERLQLKSRLALSFECKTLGIAEKPSMDSDTVVGLLRNVLIWRRLALPELHKACRNCGMCKPEIRGREELVAWLVERRVLVRDSEVLGLPAQALRDGERAAHLTSQFGTVDEMSTEELKQWYRDTGFPEESSMDRSELARLLKYVVFWQSLPTHELQAECSRRSLPQQVPKDTVDHQQALVDRLFEATRMRAWDASGFHALKIGDASRVVQVVARYEEFVAMEEVELLTEYKTTGLPIETGLEKQELLQRLKTMLAWEFLPECALLQQLREEYKMAHDLDALTGGGEEKRPRLMELLKVELIRKSFARQGHPVADLEPHKMLDLAAYFAHLQGLSVRGLREEAQQSRLSFCCDMPEGELRGCLQAWGLWGAMPLTNLWAECQQHGIVLDGFCLKSSEEAPEATPEEGGHGAFTSSELHLQLQFRLLLCKRAKEAQRRMEQSKANAMLPAPDSGDTANGRVSVEDLPEVWWFVEHMRDPLMAEAICGMHCRELPRLATLSIKAAVAWRPLEAALHVLSGNAFEPNNPRTEARRFGKHPADQGSRLVSVICPTNDKRRLFHPLLYECFRSQSYEPKELVVVDTGIVPSSFFEEVVKEDARVVYHFFPVRDLKDVGTGPDPKSKTPVWSIGLKRNIACSIAKGDIIAQFDDDDLYVADYLSWFVAELGDVAMPKQTHSSLRPCLVKLSEWHLLELSTLAFHHMDTGFDSSAIPEVERRAAQLGWGFSYVFTRSAWESAPFPDVAFAEDVGFVEGLLSRGIAVLQLRLPADSKTAGLVAHTVHPNSSTGGEFIRGRCGCDKPIAMPPAFARLMPTVKQVQVKARNRGWFDRKSAGVHNNASTVEPPRRSL